VVNIPTVHLSGFCSVLGLEARYPDLGLHGLSQSFLVDTMMVPTSVSCSPLTQSFMINILLVSNQLIDFHESL